MSWAPYIITGDVDVSGAGEQRVYGGRYEFMVSAGHVQCYEFIDPGSAGVPTCHAEHHVPVY